MTALPLFFADGRAADAWACPTCGKPWTTELTASACCPSLLGIVAGDVPANEVHLRDPATGITVARLVNVAVADPVIDTSVADPESTYVPVDDDPYEEVRTIPLEPGDDSDRALYEALMAAPDGGITPRDVERFLTHQKRAGVLTRRQHKLLAIYCAAKLNRVARRAWGAGLPAEAIEELSQIVNHYGAQKRAAREG